MDKAPQSFSEEELPTISLEEAKRITAEFSGAFTAPPRSIADILALTRKVDYQLEACAAFSLQSPEELAAGIQAIPLDYKKGKHRPVYAWENAVQQLHHGNLKRAVDYMELAVDSVPENVRLAAGLYLAQLAAFKAHAGEFDASDRLLRNAIAIQERLEFKHLGDFSFSFHLEEHEFHVVESQATNAASKGDLRLAEALYRKALAVALDNRISFDGRYEFAELALMRTVMRQGRFLEAESVLRERLKERLPFVSPIVATTFLRFSETLYEQGRYADTELAAKETVKMFKGICAEPDNLLLAEARNLLGKSLVAQERWDEALAVFNEIQSAFADDRETYKWRFSGNLYRAMALLKTGDIRQAVTNLQNALELVESRLGANHYAVAELRGFLAISHYEDGNMQAARTSFEHAIAVLLRQSRQASTEGDTLSARDQRLRFILEAYMRFLYDLNDRGALAGAQDNSIERIFQLAETIRGRSVRRALAASGTRVSLKDPELSELARREQDTGKRITTVYGTLERELSLPTEEQSKSRIDLLRRTIDSLRSARIALIHEIERRFPEYAELIDPKPPTLANVRDSLRAGEAFISTYVGEKQTYVWAIPKAGEIEFSVVAAGRDALAGEVSALREALDPGVTQLGDIPAFDVQRANRLYAKLLAPVEAGWRNAASLIVVAHGPLGHLPLSVLPTRPTGLGKQTKTLFGRYRQIPWLARSHAVTQLPSVGTLQTLRSLSPASASRRAFVGFGDPWFSKEQAQAASRGKQVATRGPARARKGISLRSVPKTRAVHSAELAELPRLPETADEVLSIAQVIGVNPEASVFTGRQANETKVKNMRLSDVRILAFATHGLVPGDLNGLSQPALALSSPEIAGGDDDGVLTMGEIMGLDLNADWVVLSACNTAAGDGTGAEAVSGLGQAFFYAGTRALLVSNWPVETTSAKALTTDIFRRQAANDNLGRAEALRRSMLALIDGNGYIDPKSGASLFSYAHPMFWAPFTIVGDGQGPG